MNKSEIFDECYELSLSDKLALRDDLLMLIDDDVKQLERNLKSKDIDYWNAVYHAKRLEDTLTDRLEEIKELKNND